MRLNELTPKGSIVPTSKLEPFKGSQELKPWQAEAIAFAKTKGFKPLGIGGFGVAFGSPNYPYVIKAFSVLDKGYTDWVEWSLLNQNNPYVPKFKGRITHVSSVLDVIRMEILSPYEGNRYIFSTLYSLIINFDTAWDDPTEFRRQQFPNFFSVLEDVTGIPYEKDEHLKSVCKFLNKCVNSMVVLDIKSANTMMRGSQMVLTDPIADVKVS